MFTAKPPRDRLSQAGGLIAAALLLAGLGYAFAGPAARLVAAPITEVWVTIIRPTPPAPAVARPPSPTPPP